MVDIILKGDVSCITMNIKNTIKTRIRNLSLEQKIRFSVMGVEIILVGFVLIAGFKIITLKYDEMIYKNIYTSSSLIVNELNNRLDALITMSNVVRSDSTIQSVLDELNSPVASNSTHYSTEIYNVLEKYYLDYRENYISYAAIYCPRFTSYTTETNNPYPSSNLLNKLVDASVSANGSALWINYAEEGNKLYLTREIKKIKYMKFDNLGSFIVCVDLNKLFSEISNLCHDFENSSWILYNDNDYIYVSSSLTLNDLSTLNQNTDLKYYVSKFGNEYYFCINGQTKINNWNYIHLVPYTQILEAQNFTLLSYIAFVLAGILLSFIFMHFIIRQTTKHLDYLVIRMNGFAKDYKNLPSCKYDYSNRQDEIGILHRQFEKMAMEIQTLINEKYKQEILAKEAELRSLEAQMNPHFIYNSLESINWRAKALKEKEISEIAISLGSFLRMTVSNKAKIFTLKDELSIIDSYMTIQQIRYDNRLVYKQNIQDMYLDAQIPKLSIQPLLENSIHYALEQITETCYITLSCFLNENNLVIMVKNTGSEFPENLLEKLKKEEIKGSGLGIALLNIDERIKLQFGNEFGLSFSNVQFQAVAKMVIPFCPIKENTVEKVS